MTMLNLGSNNDNTAIVASYTSCNKAQYSYKHNDLVSAPIFFGATFTLPTNDAIAGCSATQIFVMEGAPVINKRITTCPLRVVLADGRQVMPAHMCDIHINGLPVTLTGHIIQTFPLPCYFPSEF
jgi:hypothetical protein